MSSGQGEGLLGSTSFRLSAAYAGLLVLAFLIAGVGTWYATRAAAEAQVHLRIQLEMAALQNEIRVESMDAAIAAIRSRSESPGALEYRLATADGRVRVGDLVVDQMAQGWSRTKLREPHGRGGETEEYLILTEKTPDGSILTIGDDLDQAERVRKAVLTALAWVATVTLLVVIGAGLLLARSGMRRMKALGDALDRVGQGDLKARAPEQGGDEIARIGQGVNAMLARIDLLVVNMRRVSTDIAHDLRTPLAHVRQELETVAKATGAEEVQAAVRSAQARIDHVLHIFQAMLRLAEIDSGGVRARFATVDLAAIVERVTDAYRGDIEAAGRLLLVAPMASVAVRGDGDLIAQALANLLENAMRHTPPASSIKVNLLDAGGSAAMEVVDEGPGIAEADRERVLEPFVRLDASRTTDGAGLGLSIVSSIARLHGAALQLGDARPGLIARIVWPASSRA